MSGLERLCRSLYELGVQHVFGLPGTQNAELYSVLPGHSIRPVVASNETSASFMAVGYARVSGRVGVLTTIPGPGFTYAFPGLAEARLDSVPILVLVGTPADGGGRRFQHQRIDQAGMARALVKEVIEVRSAAEVGPSVQRAHSLALAGEPGPVMLHLRPEAMAADDLGPVGVAAPEERATAPLQAEWASTLLSRLESAHRPVVFAGAGAIAAAGSVRELAERLTAPVFTTVSGRGVVPEDHPLVVGFDPDRGHVRRLNELLSQSDLILALGCKLSHNGTAGFRLKLPPDRLVHVNTDAAALGPNYPADLQVLASVEEVSALLLNAPDPGPSEWTEHEIAVWKTEIGEPVPSSTEPFLHGVEGGTPAEFFQALRSALPRDAVVTTDAGLHQVLARRHYQVLSPVGLLTPTDFQSMGFGVPAAIGARLAAPDRPVVAIVGDGGFLFTAMDLLTATRERVPVAVVVFNDGFMNLIRLQQLGGHGRPSGVDLATPRLDVLAESLRVGYRLVDGDPEVAIRQALAEGPGIVELRVGDSAGIRHLKRRGALRSVVRRTLGQRMIDRIKALIPGHRGS